MRLDALHGAGIPAMPVVVMKDVRPVPDCQRVLGDLADVGWPDAGVVALAGNDDRGLGDPVAEPVHVHKHLEVMCVALDHQARHDAIEHFALVQLQSRLRIAHGEAEQQADQRVIPIDRILRARG